jgi:molybdenum cofactor cytidylyltransferase
MTAVPLSGPARIAAAVLAAGESTRMREDKALLRYRGRTFLETIVGKLHNAGIARVIVVLGHHADRIQQSVQLDGVEVVFNPDYRRGQTCSMQAALRALAAAEKGDDSRRVSPQAMVLALVDHPAFESATIRELISTFESTRAAAVIPTYHGRRGHPVLIGDVLFAPLLALGPDEGANTVIRALSERTQLVEVADAGILVDVDDPAGYQSLA